MWVYRSSEAVPQDTKIMGDVHVNGGQRDENRTTSADNDIIHDTGD